jgi:ribonuclease BN (tRNA processing enzyme)
MVLGCSGSYGGPGVGSTCSGYLVRAGTTAIWLDCGNGTFANLQRHLPLEDLSAVFISHRHPDHCVDLFGLHIALRYGMERHGFPVYGPQHLREDLSALADFGDTFDFHVIADGGDLTVGDFRVRFSRTDHPPETLAMEFSAGGKRLIYTADTGPKWSVAVFGPGPDLVLSEATYQRDSLPNGTIHYTAEQAGRCAKEAGAKRLVITHLWPTLDPQASVIEAGEAFGEPVTLATPGLQVRV